jgi:hypothetical protein
MTDAREQLVAYLRSLPDDWESWLVLADVLIEAGDERGHVLVLEHHRQPVRALAEAWLQRARAQLREEDVADFVWLSRFAPLAPRAPADLSAIFARPLSQLLALLEVNNGDHPRHASIFERQRGDLIGAVQTWIDRAFDGVPVPDAAHRTIHQAEAADNYESCDRSRDHLGRWQDLPDDHLLTNQWALSHLDDQGMHYYLPALMSFALRHARLRKPCGSKITEDLAYTLKPSLLELRDHEERKLARFDRAQRAAIYAFTLVMAMDPAIAAWARVFEVDRDAPCADWFAAYFGDRA